MCSFREIFPFISTTYARTEILKGQEARQRRKIVLIRLNIGVLQKTNTYFTRALLSYTLNGYGEHRQRELK